MSGSRRITPISPSLTPVTRPAILSYHVPDPILVPPPPRHHRTDLRTGYPGHQRRHRPRAPAHRNPCGVRYCLGTDVFPGRHRLPDPADVHGPRPGPGDLPHGVSMRRRVRRRALPHPGVPGVHAGGTVGDRRASRRGPGPRRYGAPRARTPAAHTADRGDHAVPVGPVAADKTDRPRQLCHDGGHQHERGVRVPVPPDADRSGRSHPAAGGRDLLRRPDGTGGDYLRLPAIRSANAADGREHGRGRAAGQDVAEDAPGRMRPGRMRAANRSPGDSTR